MFDRIKNSVVLSFAALLAAGALGAAASSLSPSPQSGKGTITGHIRLSGKLPGNAVIRMGVDPKCRAINAGKQVLQEAVVAKVDGSLANVFVRLQGAFPATPVPSTPVTIDQHGCVYSPRVVGVRVGQTLQVRNSDPLLHNVHSSSASNNGFNTAQVRAGIVDGFKMKSEEVMLRIGCDVHTWMRAYAGVVTNPYFAVTDAKGKFEISQVPAGTYTIAIWHERYGPMTKTVRVAAGGVTTIDFSYTGNEPAPKL